MQIYRCANIDCNKRLSIDELEDTNWVCPYCGESYFFESTNYIPKDEEKEKDKK